MAGRIVIVGGGITGLAAAWEVVGRGAEVTVLEASDRWGGLIRTTPLELPDGESLTVDEAADNFLARVPDAVGLCHELGLEGLLTQPAATRAKVWTGHELRWFPAGSVLGVPLDLDDLAATGLLTDDGLAAVAAESGRDDPPQVDDISIGAFLRARFGDELVDRIVGPLVGGINAGDVEEMSLQAVTPQLADAATVGGCLTDELRRRTASAGKGPVFRALLGGTATLVDALVDALAAKGAGLRPGARVTSLDIVGDKVAVGVAGPDGTDVIEADGVIVATSAAVAAALVGGASPGAAVGLATIETTSATLVTMAFRREDVPGAGSRDEPGAGLGASGFLVPRDAGMLLSAVSFGSAKWPQWDDGHHVILRVSCGHRHDHRGETLPPDHLVAGLLADLRTTMGITAEPVAVRVSPWHHGFHQYTVGHLGRVDRIDAALEADTVGRVRVAGAAYRGLGIPACIRQGREAAATLAG